MDKIIGCRAMTSTSSVIGNLTVIAMNYVSSLFPNGYIKYKYVSETFVPLVMNDDNCELDIYETRTHTLCVQPVWQPGEMSMELPRWHKANEHIYLKQRNTYIHVLEDWKGGIFIYSVPNRLKVQMNCKIKLQTAIQAMDVQSYISNQIDIGGYRYLNGIRIMTELPITLVKPICLKYDIDYDTPEGKQQLNEYLMKHSNNGITQGVNLSTGNINYQYGYNTNILFNYPEEPTRDVQPKDLAAGDSWVDFNFTMECWVPMTYLFEIKDMDEEEIRPVVDMEYYPDSSMKFTMYLDADFIPQEKGDKKLFIKQQFYPDINVAYDKLDFSSLLGDNLKDVLLHLYHEGYIMENVIDIDVGAGRKLIDKELFKVDWEHFILYTKEPMFNTTYTLVVYLNFGKVNEIEMSLRSREYENPSMVNTIQDIEIGGEEE